MYKPPSMYHDIGLLRLERGVVISPFIRPICLNKETSSVPMEVIATGWGHVDGSELVLYFIIYSLFNTIIR